MLRRIADAVLMPIPAAVGFFIGGVAVFLFGFLWTQTRHSFFKLVEQGYSNFGIELVSIALTVIVIDRLNQRRSDRERLRELITQMLSKDNGLALAALELLRLKGWLYDGSLEGVYLGKANLSGANLQGANLKGAVLTFTNLEGANLSYTNLEGANLQGANLSGANLAQAELKGADLRGAKLQDADLGWANLTDARLWNANLQGADLGEANLTYARLDGANLQGARLGGADLEGADLNEVNLQGANLLDATFTVSTTRPDGTKWTPGTKMERFTDPTHPNFWRSKDPNSSAYRKPTNPTPDTNP